MYKMLHKNKHSLFDAHAVAYCANEFALQINYYLDGRGGLPGIG